VRITTMENLAVPATPGAIGTDDTGIGALGTERGNLPLESIDVRSKVTGLAVHTELAQGFRNPYDVPLEATYIFPLPDRAAVTRLRMEADDRIIDGIVKEREEARAEYTEAIASGRRASIAEEERPGVFTLRVGNIMPGERVVIRLTLTGRLPYEDGEATYRFPLVVAPRYIPGAALPGEQVGSGTAVDTDAVPDASRITPPVLLPGFPNPVRLTAEVDVAPAGLPVTAVQSSLHGVDLVERGDGGFLVSLRPGERADRDFVLRFGYGAEDAVTTSLALCHDGAESGDPRGTDAPAEGTFLLTLLPPAAAATAMRPRDVVLVLDRSGSMGGWKMAAARRAAARIVDTLTTADRFAVLAFDGVVETPPGLSSGLVEATDRNRFRAVGYLASLEARGGTEMLDPLLQAVNLLPDEGTFVYPAVPGAAERVLRDRVLVLVTDGQVGNEDQILARLAPGLSGVRVHTIGIDRAVNAAFLRRLADAGAGRCELVESEDRLDEAMEHIHRRIGSPVVVDVRVAGENLGVVPDSVEPSRLPDLFAGAPLVVTGRFTGDAAGSVVVTGRTPDGIAWTTTVPAVVTADAGLGPLWARGRIRDLEDRYIAGTGDNRALERDIVATSVRFSVLSRFTAFVAVDSVVVNESGAVKQVTQPVDLPSGWAVGAASAAFPLELSVSAAPPAPMSRVAAQPAPGRGKARSGGRAGGRAGQVRESKRLRGGPPQEVLLDAGPQPAGGAPLPPPMAPAMPPLPEAAGPGAAPEWMDMEKERKAGPAEDVFASIAAEAQSEPVPPTPGGAYGERIRQRGPLTADQAREVVAEMFQGLSRVERFPFFDASLLQDVAGALEALLDSLTEEWMRRIVEDLLAELRSETSDRAELDARKMKTLVALRRLLGPAPEPEPERRAFWKR
jgi:Ca-activated chloride channel family protein